MCGRYTNAAEFSEIRLELRVEQLELFRDWTPTYNIAPSYGPGSEQLIVVRTAGEKRAVRLARWWMIPAFWQQPLKKLPTAFNARSEDIDSKPFWRDAFRSSRCLVPATGWREFSGERGHKQPFHFQLGGKLFAFAGVHATWTSAVGEVVESFAIVTTTPNQIAATIHDRMPLVMPADLQESWLADDSRAIPVLRDACARSLELELEVYPTDPIANNVHYEGPRTIERFSPAKAAAPAAQQDLFANLAAPGQQRSRR